MENMDVTSLDAQWRDVNERRKVGFSLGCPLQVVCEFLGLPVQDGIISENWISENQKLKEHFSHTSREKCKQNRK